MVLQGGKRPRVLKVESDEMVAAVKKNNVPVEYIVFDDEGHGFRKKENQLEGYRAILDFVRKLPESFQLIRGNGLFAQSDDGNVAQVQHDLLAGIRQNPVKVLFDDAGRFTKGIKLQWSCD